MTDSWYPERLLLYVLAKKLKRSLLIDSLASAVENLGTAFVTFGLVEHMTYTQYMYRRQVGLVFRIHLLIWPTHLRPDCPLVNLIFYLVIIKNWSQPEIALMSSFWMQPKA